MGWVGFVWFFKRQKRGAYLSMAAHLVGLGAVVIQLPDPKAPSFPMRPRLLRSMASPH